MSKETLAQREEVLYTSAQKAKSEALHHPKTPNVLTFNLEEQPPAASASRKEQMQGWRDSSIGRSANSLRQRSKN
jgi:hypothetical protein